MSDELENQNHEYPQEVQQEQPEQPKVEAKPEIKPEESQKEQNMRILRERAEAAERRARELEHYVNNSTHQEKPKQEPVEEEYDFDIKDDDFIEGKHLKKYVKNLKKELNTTKKQIAEFNQQTAVATAEVRLKSQFADFDTVVTKDNLEKLAASKPTLYRTIMASSDIYDRGYAAYEMIRGSGIVSQDYLVADKRIEENKSKPRSSATAAPQSSDSPLSRAGDYDRRILTEERKEQLRRQIEEAKRNR